MKVMTPRTVRAGVLDVAYAEAGPADGWPVVLVHGFPYDAHCYSDAAELLAREGARVVMPWMRGYGATRFLSADTPRSGQQGAFGADLLALLDALGIDRAILGGFDWGGRAACVVAALWPERVEALVSAAGYNILDPARAALPLAPEVEHRLWYVWYLHSERGRAGLAAHREDFCRLLWRLWSPRWDFSDEDYARSAAAFDNPDFVDVVTHSYRHRHGLAAGDPTYADIERRLAALPPISAPSVVIESGSDGLMPPTHFMDLSARFTGGWKRRVLVKAGHNPPQEDPRAFADAVLAARALAAERRALSEGKR
ncbi:alpha/beta fold hydrolase [Rhizorhabdus dicambivorans]|uniref:Alpha/beta hydrolase n=1 Tax=Rhizorhabdus dicambivorans TaxID=1850238 RepID=A0A2A4FVI6_9SPHN|nr:alpha/beta hydrolase [Rhizorhabdus dicambivorans]ATE63668.1 alpha/beta hydrolase [Rhizorhabdus dicambivorans]PCE42796.1 alpha/beta hydrolase [Rhizorhabdus dicambivorans]